RGRAEPVAKVCAWPAPVPGSGKDWGCLEERQSLWKSKSPQSQLPAAWQWRTEPTMKTANQRSKPRPGPALTLLTASMKQKEKTGRRVSYVLLKPAPRDTLPPARLSRFHLCE
ncbi:hypothetical protein LEMLEM_LOCUS20431, partial [Lemmus lemmus]